MKFARFRSIPAAVSWATLVVLCPGNVSLAARSVSTVDRISVEDRISEKDGAVSGLPDPVLQSGGETVASATVIAALPFSDTGNTCGFTNDYDAVCPFTGSDSPDVVYRYTPSVSGVVDVSLCGSAYDTKVYVYEDSPAALVGCNDDACGVDGFRSEIVELSVAAGTTYYIVVDGYSGGCGDYVLDVVESVPCIVDCPPGSLAEGEIVCFDDYNDDTNAGCNSVPSTFSAIPCSSNETGNVTVCGTYGGFFHPSSGFDYRDTDWYTLNPEANTLGVTWCVTGKYETLSGYLDPSLGCADPVFVESAVHGSCETQCWNIPPGEYWLFVSTTAFGPDAGACGGSYVMTLDGYRCPPISVEPTSWSKIKASYR